MPSAKIEAAILAIEPPETYALDRTATGIGLETQWYRGTERRPGNY
jgi:hypothetical protein